MGDFQTPPPSRPVGTRALALSAPIRVEVCRPPAKKETLTAKRGHPNGPGPPRTPVTILQHTFPPTHDQFFCFSVPSFDIAPPWATKRFPTAASKTVDLAGESPVPTIVRFGWVVNQTPRAVTNSGQALRIKSPLRIPGIGENGQGRRTNGRAVT